MDTTTTTLVTGTWIVTPMKWLNSTIVFNEPMLKRFAKAVETQFVFNPTTHSATLVQIKQNLDGAINNRLTTTNNLIYFHYDT